MLSTAPNFMGATQTRRRNDGTRNAQRLASGWDPDWAGCVGAVGGGEPPSMDRHGLGMVRGLIKLREGGQVMRMKEWEPALTKEECNNRELGACYCGECGGE